MTHSFIRLAWFFPGLVLVGACAGGGTAPSTYFTGGQTGTGAAVGTGGTGATATGGLGGAVTGGAVTGGAVTGGAVTGGAVTGGGGAVTGGAVTGGAVTGGAVTGGAVTGGAVTGGAVTGGAVTGGAVTGGAVTGGAVTGGAVTGGAATGGDVTGGTGGEVVDPIDCSSVSGTGLPVNATGWVDASCNSIGMQGAWYCFDDGVQTSTCTDSEPPFGGTGMCLTGTSVVDTTYAAWGSGIGLSLNETGGDDSVKTAYNATANGVSGYRLTLEGDSLGQSMRIGFSTLLEPGDNISPFVEIGELTPGTPLTVDVIISDAVVPEAWDTIPNAGEIADPTSIFDLQVQFPGGDVDGEYSYCVTNIEPITDVAVVDCDLSGAQSAGSTSQQYGTLNVGSYMIQNNVWNSAANGHQSISAYQASGGVAFVVHADSGYNVLSDANGRPGGYGSAVFGWHTDNAFHGGYTSPRAISAIGSAPSRWDYCTPAAGNWDAAYDIWIAPGGQSPTGDQGTELMIWTAYRDATPIGTEVGTETIGGANWEVWVGDTAGPWQTISFRRITNTRTVDIDLKDFFTAGDPYADYDSSHQLYGIQAGYEIWSTTNQNLNFTTAFFSAAVN